uniref:Tetratricopeptide repeat protein n=1 Tax=Acidicaldus sp. TaxID=1872105 RepID=A0A8J4H8H5_9PROT
MNMSSFRPRLALLAVTLLSACAASNAAPGALGRGDPSGDDPSGVYGDYLVGQFAASQGAADVAATKLLAALADDPSNGVLLRQAFIANLVAGRPEAVRLAVKLPDNAAAQLLLADESARHGEWESAKQRYLSLPNHGISAVLQPLLLAWSDMGAGHVDAALDILRPLTSNPRIGGIYALHAALIADLAGRDADAGRFYDMAQKTFAAPNLRFAQILASWQARHGEMEEARRTLDTLREGDSVLSMAVPALEAEIATRPVASAVDGIAETYLALAASLRQQEADDFSLIILRLALDLRPQMTAARLMMSNMLEDNGQLDNALQILANVPANAPLAGLIDLRRATIEDQLGHTSTAVALLENLAKQFPDRPEPLAQLGDIYRGKSEFNKAITAYDGALARVQDVTARDWVLFYARGICYDRAHQWPKAQADFEHALQLSPDQPYVLNYLGYSWAEQGTHLAEARKLIEKAVALKPNDGAIIDSLGWVLLRQGDPSGAVHWLERAVEMEPEDPTINGHFGDALWAAGRKLEATYQWRLALALKPEPDEAVKLEAKLKQAGVSTAGLAGDPTSGTNGAAPH